MSKVLVVGEYENSNALHHIVRFRKATSNHEACSHTENIIGVGSIGELIEEERLGSDADLHGIDRHNTLLSYMP